jgi:chemotaxis response regulator CheB
MAVPQQLQHVGPIATPDLLLQHLDETLATYVQKQLKHLQHMSETLAEDQKKLENMCVAIAKHMQHPNETLAIYV